MNIVRVHVIGLCGYTQEWYALGAFEVTLGYYNTDTRGTSIVEGC